jgi:thiosulfate dehydrogenase [quinone] large subunit
MNANCCQCDGRVCAVALGRWALGMMFFFAGIAKFPNVAQFAGYITSQFEKTWLPNWLLLPYGYALPFLEVGLGALLILGLWRNAVLFTTGLLLISLAFGQMLLQKVESVYNMMYVFMAVSVLFLDRYDRWVLGPKPPAETITPLPSRSI